MKHILNYIIEAQNFLIKGHTIKQYSYVDLDLPSGIKWASCNIGANNPEDDGLLFQWGRIDGYKYDDKNHKFLSKKDYVTTSGTTYKKGDVLKHEDDAAYQSTNGRFRMPTKDEIEELLKYTKNEWTELNGVKGRKFISKQDESKWIFIPAANHFYPSGTTYSELVTVWSASIDNRFDDGYCCIYGTKNDCYVSSYDGYLGFSVRGVLNK